MYIISMILKAFILLFISICSQSTELPLFDRTISERIFTNHQILLIYVGPEEKSKIEEMMEQICEETLQCCRLTNQSPYYAQIRNFIGYPSKVYLSILDTKERLKYVLPLGDQNNEQLQEQIFKFRENFDKKQLEPFFASQTLDQSQINPSCLKLVGYNYENFLSEEAPIKIVFLYSSDQVCQNCKDLLGNYCSLAQHYWQQNLILFGHFDVTKNDNWFIRDEIFPYFLIYVYDNFEDPYGVEAQQFKQLEGYVQQLKKDVSREMSEDVSLDDQLTQL